MCQTSDQTPFKCRHEREAAAPMRDELEGRRTGIAVMQDRATVLSGKRRLKADGANRAPAAPSPACVHAAWMPACTFTDTAFLRCKDMRPQQNIKQRRRTTSTNTHRCCGGMPR